MTYEEYLYHADRERVCRELADRASNPEIGRRHSELAELHADRAASYMPLGAISGATSSRQLNS